MWKRSPLANRTNIYICRNEGMAMSPSMKSMRHTPMVQINNSTTAILFVHGIQGSPDQFKWLIESLPQSVDVFNVLLPGHGKGIIDFAKATMKAWQEYVDGVSAELNQKYESVIYVGHSMGCLLGIDAAVRGVGKYSAMILLACPLRLHFTFRYLRNNLLSLISKSEADPFVAAARDSNSIRTRFPLLYVLGVRQYLGLLIKINQTRRKVQQLKTTVTVIHSERDEIVSIRSLDYFLRCADANSLTVPGSGHYLYSDEAREIIRDRITKCL